MNLPDATYRIAILMAIVIGIVVAETLFLRHLRRKNRDSHQVSGTGRAPRGIRFYLVLLAVVAAVVLGVALLNIGRSS